MKKILSFCAVATSSILATATLSNAQTVPTITWSSKDSGASTTTNIIGGPWTLGNGRVVPGTDGKGDETQTLNYCGSNAVVGQAASTTRNTSDGTINGTPSTNTFSPYYFPFIVSYGNYLQGYFDYRPKDTNEAIVAAYSTDGGNNWIFQQQALELNPGLCPLTNPDSVANGVSASSVSPAGSSNNATVYPVSTIDNPYPNEASVLTSLASPATIAGVTYTSFGASDDGQGHPYVTSINGKTFLYTLDRSTNFLDSNGDSSVDNLGLVVHTLNSATPQQPLGSSTDTPLTSPDVTCSSGSCVPNSYNPSTGASSKGQRTNGLLNPDGIISEVPGSYPRTILYIQKKLDYYGQPGSSTTPPPAVTPTSTNGACAYPQVGTQSVLGGLKASKLTTNTDLVTVRLASTTDGINFTDKGAVTGLNTPGTTSYYGTRWIAPTGTLIKISNTRYGLFFAGGNCMDADSDSFHYIGYAESSNLKTWTVINGIQNPIASVSYVAASPTTLLQEGGYFTTAVPSTAPLINYQSWFAGRVYSPNVMLDPSDSTGQTYLVFVAGYSNQKPASNYSSYRTITRFRLTRTNGTTTAP